MRLDELLIENINKQVLQPGFHTTKSIPNSEYVMIADCKKEINSNPHLEISVIDKGINTIAFATFVIRRGKLIFNKNLEAYNIRVNDEHRRKGIAKSIYQFVSELGNNIAPSKTQTHAGKTMWNGFNKDRNMFNRNY